MFIALRFAARMTFAYKSASKPRNQRAQLLLWHMFNVLPAILTACVVVPDLWCSLVKIPNPKLLVNAFNCFMMQMRQWISTETLLAFSTMDGRVCHATSAVIKWSSWQSSALRFGNVFCFDFISLPVPYLGIGFTFLANCLQNLPQYLYQYSSLASQSEGFTQIMCLGLE